VDNLNSAEAAAVWARRILPAKNTLHEADPMMAATSHPAEGIDKSELARVQSHVELRTNIISGLSQPSHASSAVAHLPIPIICALPKAALYRAR
jgi:hypothetical protein